MSDKISDPIVGVVMGSDSDLSVMQDAAEMLTLLEIPYRMTVISAHRTPERAFQYAKEAEEKGFEVIIAGAGGAAHLPGAIAALTALPVIGIPIKGHSLQGLDALLSIVQMPAGVPVATVGVDHAKNAAILAAEILGVKYPKFRQKIKDFKEDLKNKVADKAKRLEELGY
jgi:5-(carboxyamino)imidazole ribonucleotide mutase